MVCIGLYMCFMLKLKICMYIYATSINFIQHTEFTLQSLPLGNLIETDQRSVSNHVKDIGENGTVHFWITVGGKKVIAGKMQVRTGRLRDCTLLTTSL